MRGSPTVSCPYPNFFRKGNILMIIVGNNGKFSLLSAVVTRFMRTRRYNLTEIGRQLREMYGESIFLSVSCSDSFYAGKEVYPY